MRKVLMSLAVICTTFLYSVECVAGKVVRENRKTEVFSKISAENSIDVYYTQSDSYSVVVEADENYICKIITQVEGETLVVKLNDKIKTFVRNEFGNKVMKVHVSAPALDKVSISGGSDFYADNIECNSPFQLEASGGADAEITGLTVAGDVSISISGGADCKIKKLHAVECKLSASNGSDLNVDMELSGNLIASASGGADMNLGGKANDVSISASGGSDVNIRKLLCKSADIHKSGGSDVYR